MNADDIILKLKNRNPHILGMETYRKYSVLLPLVEKEHEIHILFEVRSMTMRSQPGDVCFPGGRVDQTDINEQFSAIRETSEELGIDPALIREVIPLDYLVSDQGRIVYPFVGKITSLQTMVLNEAEVAEVFTVPLAFFLNTKPKTYKVHFRAEPEADFPYDLVYGGKNYAWRGRGVDELFYEYEGRVIWGLTAKIVAHFAELVEKNML